MQQCVLCRKNHPQLKQNLFSEAETVFRDDFGRAWARDAYGRCDPKPGQVQHGIQHGTGIYKRQKNINYFTSCDPLP